MIMNSLFKGYNLKEPLIWFNSINLDANDEHGNLIAVQWVSDSEKYRNRWLNYELIALYG